MAARDRRSECAAVLGLFLGLAWLFFCMRMYVKSLTKCWRTDDLLLVAGLVLFTAYSICAALGLRHGTGRHLEDIPDYDIPKALYFWFLCEFLYALTTLFIRLSIATFIIRICLKRVYRIIIFLTMAMITVFTIFYFFLVIFQCSPVDYFWNQYRGHEGGCINPAAVPIASIVHSAVSCTADWTLGLLPIALIWDLQMNRRTKISLACILAAGLLAGIATIIRIPYLKTLSIADDFLYATTDVAIWSTVEAGLGIVAASAYTLRPLFRSFSPCSSHATPAAKPSGARFSRGTNWSSRSVGPSEVPDSLSFDIPLSSDARSCTRIHSDAPRDPFGDPNDDMSQWSNRGSDGIQVHRTFEVRSGDEDSQSVRDIPWQQVGNHQRHVSIV